MRRFDTVTFGTKNEGRSSSSRRGPSHALSQRDRVFTEKAVRRPKDAELSAHTCGTLLPNSMLSSTPPLGLGRSAPIHTRSPDGGHVTRLANRECLPGGPATA
jgi:hypothetical protein